MQLVVRHFILFLILKRMDYAKFLKTGEIKYQQFGDKFVPGLSIVDVLMFNSKEEVRKQLQNYTLVQEEE